MIKRKQTYDRVPIEQIKVGLADKSEALCGLWLSNGRLVDGCWRVGDITNSPARKSGSFSMVLDGRWRGKAKDWSDPDRLAFDWLDVIEANISPNDVRDTPRIAAIKWAVDYLRLGAPVDATANRRPVADSAATNDNRAELAALAAQKVGWARAIWDQGQDIDNRGNTPAEIYLRNRRITIPVANGLLRYHPSCRYKRGSETLGSFPALLAPLHRVDGSFCGVQRIYLTRDGYKAAVPEVKKTLGDPAGGAVRLVDDEDAARGLLGVAEGVETALSAMQMYEVPVWAGLSTWGVATLALPAYVREIVHFPDNDPPQLDRHGQPRRGPDGGFIYPGRAAAEAAAARYREEGRKCQMVMPMVRGCKDFNEILQNAAPSEKPLAAAG
jgi:hypothetical protein